MNEICAIVEAARAAESRREATLLATVVRVRGSSYRRPGARMLLGESGWLAGGISGGCLEGDVVRRAWWRTRNGPAVVTYDSTVPEGTDEAFDDLAWGFGLGCNGVIEVLLERIEASDTAPDVIGFLEARLRERRAGAMATVIAADDTARVGQRLLWRDGADTPAASSLGDRDLAARLAGDVRAALREGASRSIAVTTRQGDNVDVFVEVVQPPTPLVLCGAGADAGPLARMAREVGWHVTVVDPRPGALPRPARCVDSDRLVACAPDDLPRHVPLDPHTLVVVMTHNLPFDAAFVGALLPSPVRYIGILGPARRTERLLAWLRANGSPLPGLERVHGPVGLDIGAGDPATVALSALAEMQAVVAGRHAGFLRDRGNRPIHDPDIDLPWERTAKGEPAECTLAAVGPRSAW